MPDSQAVLENSSSDNDKSDLKIRTALVSTFDKRGIVEFGSKLAEHKVSLIATGGTLSSLERAGLNVTPVEKVGHFPEMLEGRVKTLQPEIFAGILAKKTSQEHLEQIRQKGISTIDMVVCNFYAFEETASKSNAKDEELIEMIDIGGPSIVRASAKNYESVCVVPSSSFYGEIGRELDDRRGMISLKTRKLRKWGERIRSCLSRCWMLRARLSPLIMAQD